MAHDIYRNKFASLRQPAWHKLGHVMQEEKTGAEAWELIGPYEVEMVPVEVRGEELGTHFAIMRLGETCHEKDRALGVVTAQYNLLSPSKFIPIWDRATGAHVETMGALGGGRLLFISTKLHTVDINGDEVDMYHLSTCSTDGKTANTVAITPVRVVCQNTLNFGFSASRSLVRITHDNAAIEEMTAEWLSASWNNLNLGVDNAVAVMTRLASMEMTKEKTDAALNAAFPWLTKPRINTSMEAYNKRIENWEKQMDQIETQRQTCVQLFEGMGVGAETKAAAGTGWGFLNAVVEMKDHIQPGKNETTVGYSTMFGIRSAEKRAAYSMILAA